MSNIINKVKDAFTGHDHTTDTTGTTGTTQHGTTHHGTTQHGTTHHAGTSGAGTTTDTSATGRTADPHRSGIANKLDPRVGSDRDGPQTAGTTGKTAGVGGYGSHHGSNDCGPHSTNLGNKLDPTIDSSPDNSHRATGGGAYNPGVLGTTDLGSGTHHTTSGPHSSDLQHKVDPRVDSGRDGSQNPGETTYGSNTCSGSTGYTNPDPHNSNIANKLDPRVDSGYHGSQNMGVRDTTAGATGLSGTGTHGTGYDSTNTGPHDTNVANKRDPPGYGAYEGPGGTTAGTIHRTTQGTSHGTTTGSGNTGPAPHTAGPHKVDMLNKLDPRIDSDGSKAHGGNQTSASPGSYTTH